MGLLLLFICKLTDRHLQVTFLSPSEYISKSAACCIVQSYWRGWCRGEVLPGELSWQRVYLQCRRPQFNPWAGKIPWRRAWQPTPVFLPGDSHAQRSLGGYSPWGPKEPDPTERLSAAQHSPSSMPRGVEDAGPLLHFLVKGNRLYSCPRVA